MSEPTPQRRLLDGVTKKFSLPIIGDNIEIAKAVVDETRQAVISIGGIRTWHIWTLIGVLATVFCLITVGSFTYGYKRATQNLIDSNQAIKDAVAMQKQANAGQILQLQNDVKLYMDLYYARDSEVRKCWEYQRNQRVQTVDTTRK